MSTWPESSFKSNLYTYTSICLLKEYKPPAAKDIPQDFRVKLVANAERKSVAASGKGNHNIKELKNVILNKHLITMD